MSGKMWFGTRGYETWVPAFATGPNFSKQGRSDTTQHLNGGVTITGSKASHRTYDVSWNIAPRADLQVISDFADGVFDSHDGPNLLYFIDPMAADRNVLPQGWATPALAVEDEMPLVVDARPQAIRTTPSPLRYPARSARYKISAGSAVQKLYIPVPPGYTAWVGIHGSSDAYTLVRVQQYSGLNKVGAEVSPVVLSVGDTTRVNTPFSSNDCTGIELFLGGATVSNTELTLSGMMVQILRSGVQPEPGGFISGLGHSGCQFEGQPATSPYSAALDRIGMTAKLVETGAYL